MAKFNNGDYVRWARRKSDLFLKEYMERVGAPKLAKKLQGLPTQIWSKYEPVEDRKIRAVADEINRRARIADFAANGAA